MTERTREGDLGRAPLPALGEALEFLRRIWGVHHALLRASKRMELTLGVTGPQRLVLRIVGRFPGIPAGHLARLLHVHPGTLTSVVRRLEQQNLVRKQSDPRDGRRALLGLTDKGRLLDVETEGTVEAAIERVLAETAPEKIQATAEVLAAIARALSVDGEDDEDDAG